MLKKHNFNLIEIIIALGIVLVGVCSLMVIFPIGANASRDAAVQIDASNAVEQLMDFIKYKVQTGGGSWVGLNFKKDCFTESDNDNDSGSDVNDKDSWTKLDMEGLHLLLFKHNDTANKKGVFQLLSARSEQKTVDYLTKASVDDATNAANNIVIDKRLIIKASYKDSGVITMNVSWPAELPYSSRNKEEFVFSFK